MTPEQLEKNPEKITLASTRDPVFDGPIGLAGKRGPMGGTPSVALVTMTKNGVKRLPALFASVLGFAQKAVILDTGSIDGAQQWLREQDFFPVTLHEYPFVNFEQTRNVLMAYAQGAADWLLLLDDDMELKFTAKNTGLTMQRDVLEALSRANNAYLMRHMDPLEYWVTRLVKGSLHWEYRGVTHEYLVGGGVGNPKLDGVGIIHNFHHGPDKFARDLKLLTADLARDPDDVRTVFYLANTLRDIGRTAAAIRFYCMRANMGGFEEEVFHSMYEAARLAEDSDAMAKTYFSRETRAEPAAWLAEYYKNKSDNSRANYWEEVRASISFPKDDVLFVNTAAYGPTKKEEKT